MRATFARADQGNLPDGLVVSDDIAIRQARLARLADAKYIGSIRDLCLLSKDDREQAPNVEEPVV